MTISRKCVPFTPFDRELSKTTIAIVTAGGVHLKDQEPFNIADELGDLTYREIAEVLKLPLGTVMSRISRGRSMLRQLLTEPRHGNRVVPLTPVSEVK